MSIGTKAHRACGSTGKGHLPTYYQVGFDGVVFVKRGLWNQTGLSFGSQATICCVIMGKFLNPSEPLAFTY